MRVRAFTIIEIMIVVVIVTAISAVVLPTLVGRVAETELGGAVRAMDFAATLAAGEAMQRGEMMAFVAERDDHEWVLYAEPIKPEQIGTVFARSSDDVPPDPMSEDGQPRRRVELASFEGVEIRERPVLLTAAGVDGTDPLGEDPFAAVLEDEETLDRHLGLDVPTERWVLGVFFADGSARPGPTVYLVVDEGRQQRSVALRALTGGIEAETIDPFGEGPTEDGAGKSDESDADEPLMPPPALAGEPAPGPGSSGDGP